MSGWLALGRLQKMAAAGFHAVPAYGDGANCHIRSGVFGSAG